MSELKHEKPSNEELTHLLHEKNLLLKRFNETLPMILKKQGWISWIDTKTGLEVSKWGPLYQKDVANTNIKKMH